MNSREATLQNLSNVEIAFEVEIPDEGEKRIFFPENVPKTIKPKEKGENKKLNSALATKGNFLLH